PEARCSTVTCRNSPGSATLTRTTPSAAVADHPPFTRTAASSDGAGPAGAGSGSPPAASAVRARAHDRSGGPDAGHSPNGSTSSGPRAPPAGRSAGQPAEPRGPGTSLNGPGRRAFPCSSPAAGTAGTPPPCRYHDSQPLDTGRQLSVALPEGVG